MTRRQRDAQRLAHLADCACHHLIARPVVALAWSLPAVTGLLRAGLARLDPDLEVCRWANETGDES